MAEGIELGSGWCESKQAYCSARVLCESDRFNTATRISEASSQDNQSLLERFLFLLGRSSTAGIMLSAAEVKVNVEEEQERLNRFDLLLVRNCGAVCVIDDALDTIEFRDLRSDEPIIESSTKQTNTLGIITEEIK